MWTSSASRTTATCGSAAATRPSGCPYDEIIEHDAEGIPYLAPEYVLLFKAKLDRDKDRADLDGVLPRLDDGRRRRLHALLARVHPGHPWLDLT